MLSINKESDSQRARTVYLTKEGLKAKGAEAVPDGVVEEIAKVVKVDIFLPILVPRRFEEIEKQAGK